MISHQTVGISTAMFRNLLRTGMNIKYSNGCSHAISYRDLFGISYLLNGGVKFGLELSANILCTNYYF